MATEGLKWLGGHLLSPAVSVIESCDDGQRSYTEDTVLTSSYVPTGFHVAENHKLIKEILNVLRTRVNVLKRELWVEKIIPAVIFFSLWLDGWLLPIVAVPVLYVLLVEKKSLGWLGFSRCRFRRSLFLGLLIAVFLVGVYCLVFFYYLYYMLQKQTIDIFTIFSDVFHYPVYEEIAYRSFFLSHFAKLDQTPWSGRNLAINLSQSFLFVSIHKHHFGLPLILTPLFLLAFLNGYLFLKTRNVLGCVVSHSVLNGSALLLRYMGLSGW